MGLSSVVFALCLLKEKQGRKLYIDAGKDLKIHKISKRVTLLILLRKIELEMLPHLKTIKTIFQHMDTIDRSQIWL